MSARYVVCVGHATLDTVAAVPRHPAADELVYAEDVVVAGGGPSATAAVALARLGVPVFFVGRVADDDVGETIRDGLQSEGVDVSELAVVPGRSPRSSVIVDTASGTRAIAAFLGDLPELELSPRAIDLCRGAAWVHVDQTGYRPARAAGRLSVDAGNPIDGLDLSSVTLFGPTESQLARLYPRATLRDAIADVLSSGVELVVVTRGADGSVAATNDGRFVAAEAAPVDVRSTLGAGDVFHGALLAALVDGASLDDALQRANTVAALSCRGLDGRSAIPTAAELEAVLEAK